MANIRFKANRAGIEQMLKSPGVQGMLRGKADAVKAYAEGLSESGHAVDYRVKVRAGKTRAEALVGTGDKISRYSNAKHNSLEKAVRNAR